MAPSCSLSCCFGSRITCKKTKQKNRTKTNAEQLRKAGSELEIQGERNKLLFVGICGHLYVQRGRTAGESNVQVKVVRE